ncbi:MAG: triose-phosphate isomerase [Neisseriaceae bacterium]|nr:MAG: triose-phosphate isomerase [Neisseriaceae bacterium]
MMSFMGYTRSYYKRENIVNWMGKIILCNWKMNGSLSMIEHYFSELNLEPTSNKKCTIGLAVPFIYVQPFQEYLKESTWRLGVQDVSQFSVAGAYTGEISASMLKDFHVQFVLVGHSERRQYFKENNSILFRKIKNLLSENITPVFCIGETLEEKKLGCTQDVLNQQLSVLDNIGIDINKIVIAYEPVWAIGTGHTPSQEEIQMSLGHIRSQILLRHSEADRIPILYGGSVGVGNAKEIVSIDHVDGLLIGGASLRSRDFVKIVESVIEIT